MRSIMLTATVLLCAGWTVADEKDAKPRTGGPPPGKGWRKGEVPAPATKSPGKGAPATKEPDKQPAAKSPAPKTDDGIGPVVSKWAKAGIHGRDLAAKIHKLHAARAKATPPGPTPTPKGKKQPEPPTPTPKGEKPKDGKNEDD